MNKMRRLIDWIKRNKLTALLGLIVLYFLLRNSFGIPTLSRSRRAAAPSYPGFGGTADVALELGALQGLRSPSILPPSSREAPPTTDVEDRLVVRETNLSLLVEEVRQTSDKIISFVETQGGYMVSSTISQPEEAPFATIVVRVPSDTLRETMDYFRSLAIKVSSEHITGRDVTDEYVDIESRLATLEKTKARFEEIMDRATKIDDILRIQREVISLQSQIDSLKGRQQYLEQTARLARVTIHMSTDEIALPYTPSETFRPNVIIKLAWRSLVRNLRKISTATIWIGVYSVIWIPVLGSIVFIKRWKAKKRTQQQQ